MHPRTELLAHKIGKNGRSLLNQIKLKKKKQKKKKIKIRVNVNFGSRLAHTTVNTRYWDRITPPS